MEKNVNSLKQQIANLLDIHASEVREDVEFGVNLPVIGTAHETLRQFPGVVKQTFGLPVIEVVTKEGDTLGRALDAALTSGVSSLPVGSPPEIDVKITAGDQQLTEVTKGVASSLRRRSR